MRRHILTNIQVTSWAIADYFVRGNIGTLDLGANTHSDATQACLLHHRQGNETHHGGNSADRGSTSLYQFPAAKEWAIFAGPAEQRNRQAAPGGLYCIVVSNSIRIQQFYEFGAFQSCGATIDVWGTNGTLQARNATLELGFIDTASEWTYKETHKVVLEANQSTEIVDHMPVIHPPIGRQEITASHSVVVWARLTDADTGKILARHVDWPQPYRVLDIPDPGLSLTVEGEHVRVEVKRPIKGLVLSVHGDGVEWEDNNMDMVPGDGRTVRAWGLGGRQVLARYLGKEA